MRWAVALFWIRCAHACIPGFVGPSCNVCPTDYVCESGTPVACRNGSRAQIGSRVCDILPNPVLATEVQRVAPKRWTGGLAPRVGTAPCGCFMMSRELSVVLDADSPILIGGVAVGGTSGSWVTRFQISYSLDGSAWRPVGGNYIGNIDETTVVERRFPYVVQARFLRVGVVDYFRWPSLRAAFLVATNTTCPTCFSTTTLSVALSTPNTTSLVAPTTTSSVAPTTTSPVALSTTTSHVVTPCPRYVNMVLVNSSTCTYACRNTTFGPRCAPRPRRSQAPPGGVRLYLFRRRPPRIESRLHSFPGGVSAMEFKTWNGSDLAVQIDGMPFMAWNMKPWRPDVGNWLLLPSRVVTRVRVRVLWNASFIVEFRATVATTHGLEAVAYARSSLTTSASWGLGDADIPGDSQSVCFVSTSRPAVLVGSWFRAFSTPNDAHAWGRARSVVSADVLEQAATCGNVSDAVQRMCLHTELSGVSAYIDGHVRRRCSHNSTIFVPPVSRTQVWHVALVFVYMES